MLCCKCPKDTQIIYLIDGKPHCPNCFDKLEKEEQEKENDPKRTTK